MPTLPEEVRQAAHRHLTALDAGRPGLVAGLYITGSVALGDYRPGRSDIDFIALTSREPDAADLTALARLHDSFRADGPAYDGCYICGDELANVPDREQPRPHVLDGQFAADQPCRALTPSTWTEFARYGIAARGPEASGLGVRISRERLDAWQRDNLNGYWHDLAQRAARAWAQRDPGSPVPHPESVAWCALGPPRLHHTLATGDIASKTGAGRYARARFPAYAGVLDAALHWRASGAGSFTHADAVRVTELMSEIIRDAGEMRPRDQIRHV